MVGNLEVGLIGPQAKLPLENPLEREISSLDALKRKESLDKGERISADLFLSANPADVQKSKGPFSMCAKSPSHSSRGSLSQESACKVSFSVTSRLAMILPFRHFAIADPSFERP
jgi:hypothetical protein